VNDPLWTDAMLQQALEAIGAAQPRDESMRDVVLDFCRNSFRECEHGLLAKTSRVRVEPDAAPRPHRFRFEIDVPFLSRRAPEEPARVEPGPVRGWIAYRLDLFESDFVPPVIVRLDRDLHVWHPHVHPGIGLLCTGRMPQGGVPLASVIEHWIYPILTGQQIDVRDPLNPFAAADWVNDRETRESLPPPAPLY